MRPRAGARWRTGAYSQAAEPRRGRVCGDWRGATNAAKKIKRLLTRAFRFAVDPCEAVDVVPLAVHEPRNATDLPGYSRARSRIAAINPITSKAPTSPTTPFQP